MDAACFLGSSCWCLPEPLLCPSSLFLPGSLPSRGPCGLSFFCWPQGHMSVPPLPQAGVVLSASLPELCSSFSSALGSGSTSVLPDILGQTPTPCTVRLGFLWPAPISQQQGNFLAAALHPAGLVVARWHSPTDGERPWYSVAMVSFWPPLPTSLIFFSILDLVGMEAGGQCPEPENYLLGCFLCTSVAVGICGQFRTEI